MPSRFPWSQSSPKKRKPPKISVITSNAEFPNSEVLVFQTTRATETDICTSQAGVSSSGVNEYTNTQGNVTEDVKELLEKLKSLELENTL